MIKIDFPPGWNNKRFNIISADDFIQISKDISPLRAIAYNYNYLEYNLHPR